MKRRRFWGFKLPSLPKDTYMSLKALCENHGATQWQVIIAAIMTLSVADVDQHEDVSELMGKVKNDHPVNGTPIN